MKLSELAVDLLQEYITGDNGRLPYLTGQKILRLFNTVGFKDIYKWGSGGMPDGLSRKQYVFNKMMEINGKKEMKVLLETVVDPRHMSGTTMTPADVATALNEVIGPDGFRLELINGAYKIVGADLPDEVAVDVHFKEIQQAIIQQIQSARFLIWVAVAWFTDRELMNELYKKKKEGVNIQIIIIDDKINGKLSPRLETQFETHRIKPEGRYENLMHNKFCIIDLRTVIHGSYNWTVKAQYNKETITIDNSREIAEKFAAHFVSLKT
jgi:phosphatidylserine/phosphatidylglycerophosphate/cardiolipin synthase-like enzyme